MLDSSSPFTVRGSNINRYETSGMFMQAGAGFELMGCWGVEPPNLNLQNPLF